jgi:hypothetical protein
LKNKIILEGRIGGGDSKDEPPGTTAALFSKVCRLMTDILDFKIT